MSDESAATESAIDITADWKAGSLTISEGGEYYISEDFETEGTLYLAAPEGETVTLDFQGHCVTVKGAVDTAIDVSGSKGQVVLFDSTAEDRADEESEESESEPVAGITLEANKVSAVASTIVANYDENPAEDEGVPSLEVRDIFVSSQLNTVDADSESQTFDSYGIYLGYASNDADAAAVDVVLENCSLAANVNNLALSESEAAEYRDTYGEVVVSSETSGLAAGIYTTTGGLSLAGTLTVDTASEGEACDIYSTIAPAFVLQEGFSAEETLSVYAAGNVEETAFATFEENDSRAEEYVGYFTDATDNSLSVEASESTLLFAEGDYEGDAAADNDQETSEVEESSADEDSSGQLPSGNDGEDTGVADSTGDTGYTLQVFSVLQSTSSMATALEAVSTDSAINLNTEWGDLSTSKTLSESGSYYLSADLTAVGSSTSLTISSAIEINLNGYVLKFCPSTSSTNTSIGFNGITISKNSSLKFTDSSDDKTGKILFENTTGGITLTSTASKSAYTNANSLELNGVTVEKTFTLGSDAKVFSGQVSASSTTTAGLINAGVGQQYAIADQSITIKDSRLSVDYGTGVTNASATSDTAYVIAINGRSVKDVTIDNSELSIKTSPNMQTSSSPASPITACVLGYTKGSTSSGNGEQYGSLTITGGSSFSATSPNGDAVGIDFTGACSKYLLKSSDDGYGVIFRGTDPITINTSSANGYAAYGIITNTQSYSSVLLDAPLSFTSNNANHIDIHRSQTGTTALTSLAVASAFSASSSVSGGDESAATLYCDIAGTVNPVGYEFATYQDGWTPSSSQKTALEAMFTNAAEVESFAVASAGDTGLSFAVGEEAMASIEHDGAEVEYASFAEAVSAVQDDETITLLSDVKTATFSSPSAETSASSADDLDFSVDLNGYSMESFTCSSAANVTLKDSTGNSAALSSVAQSGSGQLNLEGIKVEDSSLSSNVTAITVSGGSLYAKDCSISAFSNVATAYGIQFTSTASGATVFLNNCTVSATSGSAMSYGILAQKAGTYVRVQDSAVTAASSANAAAYGLSISYCKVSVDNSTISATHAGSGTSKAVGVYANGTNSSEDYRGVVSLNNTTVKAENGKLEEGETDENVYALYCNSATTSTDYGPLFELAGTCSLSSSGSVTIGNLGTSLSIGESFALAEGTSEITVSTATDLPNDVLAVVSDADAEMEDLALVFSAAEDDSNYAGYDLVADGSNLVFSSNPVVYVTSENDESVGFANLKRAVKTANEGDTICLAADISLSSSLEIDKSLTIDLCGYDLSIAVSGADAYNQGAVVVENTTSDVVICDNGREATDDSDVEEAGATSSEAAESSAGVIKGSLSISVASNTKDKVARGLSVAGAGSLVLDGCAVEVVCDDDSSLLYNASTFGVAGAYLSTSSSSSRAASLSLKNGASLTVSSRRLTNSGASESYGIYVVKGSSAADGSNVSVTVDESSSIAVDNQSPIMNVGVISSTSNSESLQDVVLRELSLDEDDVLYQAIAEEFKKVAEYDGESTYNQVATSSSVYGAGIYYAAPLEVDGTYYWVFSNYVSNPGNADDIVPAKIYMQSTYQVAPEAVGIAGASGSNADVTVQGSVSAACAEGDAVALQSSGDGTWTVDGASLSAVSEGTSSYRKLGDIIKLGDVLEGVNSDLNVYFYPSDTQRNQEVVEGWPQAIAVNSDGSAKVVLQGAVSMTASAACDEGREVDIMAESVTIGEGFSLCEGSDNPLTFLSSTGSNTAGETFAVAADGVSLTADQAALFEDADGINSSVVDDGELEWGDSYTIQFIDAYGQVVKEVEGVLDGETVVLPDSTVTYRDRTSETIYEFAGWSLDSGAQAGDDGVFGKDDTTFNFDASSVNESVVSYYAVYAESPVESKVTFAGYSDADADVEFDAGGGTVPVGSTLKEAKNNGTVTIPNAPAQYTGADGKTYYFIGWRTDSSAFAGAGSVSAIYDEDSLMEIEFVAGTSSTGISASFTPVYLAVGENQYLVKFKVQNTVVAYVVDADGKTAPSYYNATAGTTSQKSTPSPSDILLPEDGIEYTFAGWYSGWSSSLTTDEEKVSYSSGTALPVGEAGKTYTYTALFDAAKESVSFSFVYYMKNDNGTYSYGKTSDKYIELACEYGSDPISLVSDVETSFTQNGMVYTFLGWSTRYNDKEPMYTDSLPAATSSATYWGIYRVEEQTATVTFVVDGEEYASVQDVAFSTTVNDAFAATGADTPTLNADGQKFVGWSDVADDDATLSGTTAAVGDLVGAEDGSVTLYAVFGSYSVTLDYNNGTGSTYAASAVEGGTVVLPEDWTNPGLAGYSFDGWATTTDAEEADFDIARDAVSGNMTLYAVYRPIAVDVSEASGAEASAEGAWVTSDSAVGSEVVLALSAVDALDSNLSDALGANETALQAYTLSLGWENSSETVHANSDFGTVSITLPVSADYADHDVVVRWLKADGTAGQLSSSSLTIVENEDGSRTVTAVLDNYADSACGGNLVVAYVKTSEEIQLANTVSNALDTLNTEMAMYDHAYEDEGNYDEDAYAEIVSAYNAGVAAVNAATTASEAADAANDALDAMAAVTSNSEIASAKAAALQTLAEAYAGYSKSSYTDANWNTLVAAYESAKSAINNATTVSGAGQAATDGVTAMSSVSAGGTSSSTTSTTSSSGLSSSSGTTSSSGSGLSSSSGSGLSSSSSGESGLSSSSGGSDLTSSSSTSEQMVGATLQDVTEDLASELGLSVASGIYVESVDEDSPAAAAGIEAGDVITAVDGVEVSSLEELDEILSGKSAGDTVTLTVDRNGETLEFDVVLDEASSGLLAVSDDDLTDDDTGVGSGEEESDAGGLLQWLENHLPIVIVAALVLLAAVAGLVWWLLRRRNAGQDEDAYAEEGGEETSQTETQSFQF